MKALIRREGRLAIRRLLDTESAVLERCAREAAGRPFIVGNQDERSGMRRFRHEAVSRTRPERSVATWAYSA